MDIHIDTVSEHILTGRAGEDIALKFLLDKGFFLLGRNIRYKWGEIDLIFEKHGTIHFVEVKTRSVIHETSEIFIKPQDNMTNFKFRKLCRSIETFLFQTYRNIDISWQIDLISVIIRQKDNKILAIEWDQNIVL